MTDRIVTEDGVALRVGDRAYNYYDMVPGTIGELTDNFHDKDPWFWFHRDDGRTKDLLNGQRICTIEFARRRKFRDA